MSVGIASTLVMLGSASAHAEAGRGFSSPFPDEQSCEQDRLQAANDGFWVSDHCEFGDPDVNADPNTWYYVYGSA